MNANHYYSPAWKTEILHISETHILKVELRSVETQASPLRQKLLCRKSLSEDLPFSPFWLIANAPLISYFSIWGTPVQHLIPTTYFLFRHYATLPPVLPAMFTLQGIGGIRPLFWVASPYLENTLEHRFPNPEMFPLQLRRRLRSPGSDETPSKRTRRHRASACGGPKKTSHVWSAPEAGAMFLSQKKSIHLFW